MNQGRIQQLFGGICKLRAPWILLALAACMSCSVIQPVRVLPEGKTQIAASLGGPWVPQSSPVFIAPYFTVGAMHGISENVTLTGNIHAIMAAFGTLGLDAGAAVRLMKQNGAVPELTAKGQLYFWQDLSPNPAANTSPTRLMPHITLNGSYAVGEDWLFYGALENTFQFVGSPSYFFTPTLGAQYTVSPSVMLQAETKWMAANVFSAHGIFEGRSSIGGNGSIAFFVGMAFTLGK